MFRYLQGKNFLYTLIILLIVSALLGSLFGRFSSKEGYYYKVGKAHTFMPGTMSNPEDSVLNCGACNKKKNCYNY